MLALIISLERVNKKRHHGWDGYCPTAKTDADRVSIMLRQEYKVPVSAIIECPDELATWGNIRGWLYRFTNSAETDFFIYYTGHGTQKKDKSGDETDGLDEALCFYDRQVKDDEFLKVLYQFSKDTNITIVTDCCNSGTICDVSEQDEKLKANVWHLAACHDDQSALSESVDAQGGVFTGDLMNTLYLNEFNISYADVIDLLNGGLTEQTCMLSTSKTADPNAVFLNYKPPKVESASVSDKGVRAVQRFLFKLVPDLKQANPYERFLSNVKQGNFQPVSKATKTVKNLINKVF